MHPYKIAIVGLGPKGLYAFERLMAQLHEVDGERRIEIHLFEKIGNFGAGEIYDYDQPEYLLMNYPNRNINVWPDEHPKPSVPETLNFVRWLSLSDRKSDPDLENGFSPRSMVGNYLQYCCDLVIAHHKEFIRTVKHTAKVKDIRKTANELVLEYKENEELRNLSVNDVILTTGHSSCTGKLEKFAKDTMAGYADTDFIPYVYPFEERLGNIRKNSTIGIKGLGLTFIDTVLALTEGRGGKFEALENGNLIYLPSRDEPNKIIAFSRTGLPMIPRNGKEGLAPYQPIYFTYENIRERAGINKKISFVEHVIPLFIAEMEHRYYSIVFERQNLSFYPDKDLNRLKEQINAFHEQFPNIYKLKFGDLFKTISFDNSTIELGALAYMRYILKEAELGSEQSAFMAAAMTWGRLSETFNSIYNFGGMTADSHYIFDAKYRSKLNRISYGPPLENAKKILALVETGIVTMDFAQNPEVKKLPHGWAIYNSHLNFQKVDMLIDARIPSINSTEDWSPLLCKMMGRGLLRPYILHDVVPYNVGCPEINKLGQAIQSNGETVDNISFYGTPTEGATYDNDSLSRSRNNFASQWALNVVENYKTKIFQPEKEESKNG